MLVLDIPKLIEGFTIANIFVTIVVLLAIRFIYKCLLRPFLELRAYRNIPGVAITYNIGSKKVWEYNNLKEKPIKFQKESPFLITEENTLLLKNPDLKVIVSNLFLTPMVTVIDHILNTQIVKNHDNYFHLLKNTITSKLYAQRAMIFTTEDDWKRQRKIISGAFNFNSIQKTIPIMQDVAKEIFEKETFANGKELFVLQSMFLRYTWEAFSRSFFGDNLQGYTFNGKSFSTSLNNLLKEESQMLMNLEYLIFEDKAAWWNSSIRNQKRKAIEFGKFADKILKQMKEKIERGEMKNADGRKGILELMLESSHENNDNLTNSELLGNFFSFSFAGSDTSANTMSNLVYCLATNLEVKVRVVEDIKSNWDGESPLTMEITNKMEYLHATILETLRVMSPAPFILPRVARRDHMIGNIPIKKGYIVQALFNPTWFSPRWIRNPELFQPERWIKGHEAYQQPEDMFVFTPFSYGPRNCIGQHFGMTQMKIALCYFLTRFDFTLPADFQLTPMVSRGILEPRELVKMFIKPKEKAN